MSWCIISPEPSAGGCIVASMLHGCARTTPRIRAELQGSKESAQSLARRYGLTPKTVTKWKGRANTLDGPHGAARAPQHCTNGSPQEAIVVEFQRRTLLPLDDVLGCLRDTIPNLTRNATASRVFLSAPRRLASADDLARPGLATFTSTPASCDCKPVNCTCSWRSTQCQSSRTSSSTTALMPRRGLPFCAVLWQLSRTSCTRS
jgi:hypothetical protein